MISFGHIYADYGHFFHIFRNILSGQPVEKSLLHVVTFNRGEGGRVEAILKYFREISSCSTELGFETETRGLVIINDYVRVLKKMGMREQKSPKSTIV